MTEYNKLKKSVYASLIAGLVLGLTFLFMEKSVYSGGRLAVVFLGMLFWASFICELVYIIHGCRIYKSQAIKFRYTGDRKHALRPLSFFKNPPAIVSDVLMILAALAAVALAVFSPDANILYFLLMFTIVVSVTGHIVFNSNIYTLIAYTRGRT